MTITKHNKNNTKDFQKKNKRLKKEKICQKRLTAKTSYQKTDNNKKILDNKDPASLAIFFSLFALFLLVFSCFASSIRFVFISLSISAPDFFSSLFSFFTYYITTTFFLQF